MAPITQDIVDGLKDQIGRLESKVADLEGRLGYGSGSAKPQSLSEQMRIILMGPPGAGMLHTICGIKKGSGNSRCFI